MSDGKLPSKAEIVRKKLENFPNGIKFKHLIKETGLSKTTLYECLTELKESEKPIYHKRPFWYPRVPENLEKQSKKRQGFFDWLEKRQSRNKTIERETQKKYRQQINKEIDVLASLYPFFKPLKLLKDSSDKKDAESKRRV
ncbi:MAG: hypothetical protein QW279_12790 [Candidatus Jordarchaeaceae archaeon]